jgi:hypothetical protein
MHKISGRHLADADINGSFNYTGPLPSSAVEYTQGGSMRRPTLRNRRLAFAL